MKSIEFSEDELGNLQSIGARLLYDETDPRSPLYKRVLVRPTIKWIRILICILVPVIGAIALYNVMLYNRCEKWSCVLVPLGLLFVYCLCTLKRAMICLIRIYQRYAPASIRNKCRFEPSCSEYTILAINKKGLIKGSIAAIDRMKRCNINNGGIDLP